jgi:hypothetical protein
MQSMPTLPDRNDCLPRSINSSESAVGSCSYPLHNQPLGARVMTAALWHEGGVFDPNILLTPTLGLVLIYASGINDDGDIIAWTDDHRGYLLTPIPEHVAECGGVPC